MTPAPAYLRQLFPDAEIVPCVADYVILPLSGKRVEMGSVLVEVDGEQITINVCRVCTGEHVYVYYYKESK